MDKNTEIDLTVLMPAYNAELHIEEALKSILNQTYAAFEFMIINDGSSDKTEEIIEKYAATDSRIRYVKNERNLGLHGVLNKGVGLTTTKYLARMDSDDIALPYRLAKQVEFMELNPTLIASGGQVKYIGNSSKKKSSLKLSHEEILGELIFKNPMIHPTVILRNDMMKRNGINYQRPDFITSDAYIWPEDYGLWYDLSKAGKLANLKEIVLEYRIGEQSISIRDKKNQLQRYTNFYRYLFSDLGVPFEKEDLKAHFELVSGSELSFPPNRYKLWLKSLNQSLASSDIIDERTLKKQSDFYIQRLFFKCADKSIWLGLQGLFLDKFQISNFKYLVTKWLRPHKK